MPWIQIKINATAKTANKVSNMLMGLGAQAVTYMDAQDTPVDRIERWSGFRHFCSPFIKKSLNPRLERVNSHLSSRSSDLASTGKKRNKTMENGAQPLGGVGLDGLPAERERVIASLRPERKEVRVMRAARLAGRARDVDRQRHGTGAGRCRRGRPCSR